MSAYAEMGRASVIYVPGRCTGTSIRTGSGLLVGAARE